MDDPEHLHYDVWSMIIAPGGDYKGWWAPPVDDGDSGRYPWCRVPSEVEFKGMRDIDGPDRPCVFVCHYEFTSSYEKARRLTENNLRIR